MRVRSITRVSNPALEAPDWELVHAESIKTPNRERYSGHAYGTKPVCHVVGRRNPEN